MLRNLRVVYYRPVIVEMCQFVGQPLHVVRLEACPVPYHIVVCGGDSALSNRLAHKVEVIPGKNEFVYLYNLLVLN